MSDLFWLTDEQMAKLSPFFPKSHGKKKTVTIDAIYLKAHRTATGLAARSVAPRAA